MIVARDACLCQAESMLCPSCGQRKAKRDCPALRQTICSTCCGTKRLVEIKCVTSCTYLASAREHPAAVVRRKRDEDVARLLPTIRHLTERQYQLFFLLQTAIARHRPEGFARLHDSDVADAAAALASTLETASRGLIYEHRPQSSAAQSLMGSLQTLLKQIREQGATVYDGETAIVLRAIEQGVRTLERDAGAPTAYLDLMGRLLQVTATEQTAPGETAPASSLILP